MNIKCRIINPQVTNSLGYEITVIREGRGMCLKLLFHIYILINMLGFSNLIGIRIRYCNMNINVGGRLKVLKPVEKRSNAYT